MGDGKSTNKTSRATAYQALGRAEDSMCIVSKERNTRNKFLFAFGTRLMEFFAQTLLMTVKRKTSL